VIHFGKRTVPLTFRGNIRLKKKKGNSEYSSASSKFLLNLLQFGSGEKGPKEPASYPPPGKGVAKNKVLAIWKVFKRL